MASAFVIGVVPCFNVNEIGAVVPCWKLDVPPARGETYEKVYAGFGRVLGNATTKSLYCFVCPEIVGSTPT